jgi:hypothetical protein
MLCHFKRKNCSDLFIDSFFLIPSVTDPLFWSLRQADEPFRYRSMHARWSNIKVTDAVPFARNNRKNVLEGQATLTTRGHAVEVAISAVALLELAFVV